MRDSSFLHRSGVARAVTGRVCCESFTETLFLKERGGKKDKEARCCPHSVISDGSVAVRKVLPYFLKWGGPGVRRKGLPQASAAVWWSVTGSFPRPAGTQSTLWSVSISDLPGWMDGGKEKKKKSAQHIFIHMLRVQKSLIAKSLSAQLVCFFFLFCFVSFQCLAD